MSTLFVPEPTHFFVWSERALDFAPVPVADVRCGECGADWARMNLSLIDRVRGEWMLECECGEQFFTHND